MARTDKDEKYVSDDDVAARLEHAAATLSAAAADVAELHEKLRLARGTRRDVTPDKPAEEPEAPQPVQPRVDTALDLRARVELALRRESLSLQQVAKAVGATAGKVADVMKQLRDQQLIFNIGFADTPVWTWRVGDSIGTPELTNLVRRLIMEQPGLRTRQLAAATGARLSRVEGVIIHLRRTEDLRNKGSDRDARWVLYGDYLRSARLPPKAPKAARARSQPKR